MERKFMQLSPWQVVIAHVLGWFLYTCATVFYQEIRVSVVDILSMVIFIIPLFYTLVWLIQRVIRKDNFKLYLGFTLIFCICVYIISYFLIYHLLPRFNIYLTNSNQPFSLSLFIIEVTLGLGKLIFYAVSYVLLTLLLESKNIQNFLQTSLEKFELQALQKELSAHTQFGLLQQWQGLTIKDEKMSKAYPVELASLYEYQFKATQEVLVPLSEEIQKVKHVAKLIRPKFFENYENWIVIRKDETISEAEINELPIPPFALVSLLENACKYGDLTYKKNMSLVLFVSKSELIVTFANKIGKARPFIKSNGIGNKNLKRRLSLLFPNQSTFETYIKNDFFYAIIKIMYHEKV